MKVFSQQSFLSQLAILTQQRFYDHLDHENEEREAEHRKALTEAAAEHDRVRRSAEQFREQLELQIHIERQREEEVVQEEIERQRKEKLARDEAAKKREIERAQAAELDARKAAEAEKAKVEALEQQRRDKERRDSEIARRLQQERDTQRAQQERQQQERQAAEKQAKAQEAAATTQVSSSAPTAQPSSQLSTTSASSVHETEHARYKQIHKNLKELRKFMTDQARQNAELKNVMGEMRRGIKKSVGQIREGKVKGQNTKQLQSILTTLKKAAELAEPTIDITMFLASPPSDLPRRNCPALFLYLLNIFSKAIVAQLVDEASAKPQIADNVGTISSHIFAVEALRWHGHTVIDILISKIHIVCPVLFGIYGDEKSPAGKDRLGWRREAPNGPFITELTHFGRMTGLGAGFAGISLRNYEKAVAKNPYPDYHYWQCLARVTNVPPNQITQTHFVVLKAMIEGYEGRFLQFYGDAAMAALRHALIELPRRSPQSVAAKTLAGLVDVQRRELRLLL